MPVGRGGWPVCSNPTERLVCHRLLKGVDAGWGGGVSEHTVQHGLLCGAWRVIGLAPGVTRSRSSWTSVGFEVLTLH